MKVERSRHILESVQISKFMKNSFRGNRIFPCGQMGGKTDRHDEAFLNFANAPKSGQKLKNTRKKERSFNTLVENLRFNILF